MPKGVRPFCLKGVRPFCLKGVRPFCLKASHPLRRVVKPPSRLHRDKFPGLGEAFRRMGKPPLGGWGVSLVLQYVSRLPFLRFSPCLKGYVGRVASCGHGVFYACAFELEETAGKNDVIETAHVACFFVFLTVCFGGFNGITYIYPPKTHQVKFSIRIS